MQLNALTGMMKNKITSVGIFNWIISGQRIAEGRKLGGLWINVCNQWFVVNLLYLSPSFNLSLRLFSFEF